MSKQLVTLNDIAKAMGVSRSMVSACLSGAYKNGGYRIGEQRAQTIREYAESIGYVPNAKAQALRYKGDTPVGLALCQTGSEIKSIPALRLAMNTLDQAGREYVVSGFCTISNAIYQFKRAGVRDFIIFGAFSERCPSDDPAVMAQHSKELDYIVKLHKGMRSFWVDYNFPYTADKESELEIYRFGIDRTNLIVNLIREFKASHGGNFACLEWYPVPQLFQMGLLENQEQVFSNAAAMTRAGMDCTEVGRRMAEHIIKIRNRCDIQAVFAADELAGGLLIEFEQYGLRVPEDIQLFGFDNLSFSAYFRVPLTTFGVPQLLHTQMTLDHILGLGSAPHYQQSAPDIVWRKSGCLEPQARIRFEKSVRGASCSQ